MTNGRVVEGDRVLGSGFALTPLVAVTADHVVRDKPASALRFADRNVTRIAHAADLDVAVLFLDEPVSTAFPAARARVGATWHVSAQPLANDPRLTGAVTDVGRSVVNQGGSPIDLLQLRVDQQLGSYKGYSGSAVLSGGGVIGVLVEQVMHRVPRGQASNVLYSVPIQEVLTRFGLRPDADTVLGLAGMGTEYAVWIENFLAEYLGRPDQPLIPFGGRDSELAALSSWLTGPAPYALITAEAGRGKSALLTHWAAQVYTAGLADVIFVPISIRFNTAPASVALPALATRLAAYHGEALTTTERSAEQWQAEISTYLRRPARVDRPLLIIVDGLDEATDWEVGAHLFPAAPPAGLKVLASARLVAGDPGLWRDRLNWPSALSVALPPLDPDGVGDVLRAMGNPLAHLVTRVDIVGELYRLSEGDPLLVRLYVESLREQDVMRLTAEDLPSIDKGMRGYYDRWRRELERVWSAEKRRDLQDFFNILACALGPLSRDDLAEINPSAPSGLELDWLVRDIGRFVIGDGFSQGFVFSHPRFAMFFDEVMGRRERDRWNAAFIDYGRRVRAGLNNGPVPEYVVRFHGAHLELANAPAEDLYALLDGAWLKAWHAVGGADAGFLNDCDRAWRRAEQDPDLERAVEVQFMCAVARGSVAARNNNVPAQLLVECFKEGMFTAAQALAICRRMSIRPRRAGAAVALAKVLPAQWLDEVLAVATSQQREDVCADALVELVPLLSGQTLARALAIAQTLRQPHARAAALAVVSSRLPEPQRSSVESTAMSAVTAIQGQRRRAEVIAVVASRLTPAGLAYAVLEAEAMTHPPSAVRTLCVLARYSSAAARESAIAKALAIAERPGLDLTVRAIVRFAIAEHVPQLRLPAIEEVLRLERKQAASMVLTARTWIGEVPREYTSGLLIAAVLDLFRRGDAEGLAVLAEQMSPVDRAEVWRRMLEQPAGDNPVAVMASFGRPEEVEDVFPWLLQRAEWLPAERRAVALTALAGTRTEQSKRDMLTEAVRSAQMISDIRERQAALIVAVRALAGSPDFVAAQGYLFELYREHTQSFAHFDMEIADELVDEALALCKRVPLPYSSPEVARRLVELVPENRRADVRQFALAEARHLGFHSERLEALGELARIGGYGDELDRVLSDEINQFVAHYGDRLNDELVPWARGPLIPPYAMLPSGLPDWCYHQWALAMVDKVRPSLLPQVIPYLSAEHIENAVNRALAADEPDMAVRVANAVANSYAKLPMDMRGRLFPVALGPLDAPRDYPNSLSRIRQLAPHVPEVLRERVVTIVRELFVIDQAYILPVLREHYPAELIRVLVGDEPLDAPAHDEPPSDDSPEIRTADEAHVRAAWQAAVSIRIRHERENAVANVSRAVASLPDLLPEVLNAVVRIRNRQTRYMALAQMVDGLTEWRPEDQTIWNAALRVLAEHPRPVSIRELVKLASCGTPSGLTPAQTARAFVHALQRVTEWWD
ncbi:hypothetical protein DMH04_03515 [Kibdelosporangium aridum]|uniref:Orc1-like AAA ATPase domain-containing protein n=1 Tax=Kibdelosporangium aridum TaxID=2030 RepID=A0A428ZR61_KIBAR|nr:serine protease [Kibdelosporangium aridum]RSM90547.1 hypothetical protein DMH04_03515 [Kibdelosporangium aridum]